MKPALIVATAVEVHCPHCGEPQPCPGNGSHMWLPYQVTQAQGQRECTACDKPFRLIARSKATVMA